ncbi:MAG: hypothetical protein ACRDK7_00820 [Solirubrobacteraceae bacterium]
MSSDPSDPSAPQASTPHDGDPRDQASQPSEDEMRAAYEAELSRITSADMILQSAVSLLNLGGRRLGLTPGSEGERDLEQVREAVDGVRALLEILERRTPAQELRPLRDALSQLQMAYARAAQGGGADAGAPAPRPGAEGEVQPPGAERGVAGGQGAPGGPAESKPGAGPAESSGRLWVPGR